jgi:60 kDa SS-A/Ro ribonucleoprotein
MRFNILKKNKTGADTLNLAGGESFSESPRLELAALLLTSTLQGQYYRAAEVTAARLKQLIAQIDDKKFVAKAVIYARTKAGMRSITHLAAGELARTVKGQTWTASFYDKVTYRPDDALEILAYYLAVYGKPVPNALKRGLGAALSRFDEYQLAKYRKSGAEISLVDAVNLVHPKHTLALKKLVDGTLAAAETWETKMTQAGAAANSEGELAELKKETWEKLIKRRKLGYFALLRNLRNILSVSPESADDAMSMLIDENLIRKSLVLPFRYLTALDALQNTNLPRVSEVLGALGAAVDKSLQNVPQFEGKTLIALDGSGSMQGRPIRIGSLFAATLAKANDADVLLFSDDARYVSVNKRDSTLTVADWLARNSKAAGTNFHAVFQTANRAYERIVILSDMQGWMGTHAPTQTFAAYKKKYGTNPKIFSFDLQGYGTLQFPEQNIYCLAGFSDKTLDTLKFLDSDKTALIHEIEAIPL